MVLSKKIFIIGFLTLFFNSNILAQSSDDLPKGMNIYALKNHKIKVKKGGFNQMYESDAEQAKKYLKEDSIYRVEQTFVKPSNSYVLIQEVSGIRFNTSIFEDVTTQKPEKDQQHPDWLKYKGYELISIHFNDLDVSDILLKLGYDRIEIPSLISKWHVSQNPKNIENDVKEFEKAVIDYLDVVKKELDVYVKECLDENK